VRLSTIGLLDENNIPSIAVTTDIVYGSLIYKSDNDTLTADVSVEIQIKPQNDNKSGKTEHFNHSLTETDPDVKHRQSVFTIERNIKVDPGQYSVVLVLTDQNSGKSATREAHTFIPDPQEEVSALTDIRLMGKDMDDADTNWFPITTYDVPGRIDSLKFVFQVTNNKANAPLNVQAELNRFKSDASAAHPLHYANLTMSNVKNRGIEYDETETIQTTQRIINQPGSVLIQFGFPKQEHGNYRFHVQAKNETGDDLFKAREFGIKSENYPALKTAKELAEPLIYLMGKNEHEELMAISDPDSLKEMVDRYWLRNVGNKHKARSVIELFYERVEEANKQFSNFKEGWKTDMGMIYILFGPPWYVDRRLDEMQWMYSYNRLDPKYNFYFKRSKLKTEYYPFDSYVLHRDHRYFTLQYQQISLWLSGHILTRQI
jgi:GWxTD domain-containing protein